MSPVRSRRSLSSTAERSSTTTSPRSPSPCSRGSSPRSSTRASITSTPRVVAKERGIKVVESRSSEVKDYTSMISVTIKTAKGETIVAGTIFGRQEPRIVRINKFTVEVIPEGRMFVMFNYDKPGVIGNIGTTLGENDVNISRLHLSRDTGGRPGHGRPEHRQHGLGGCDRKTPEAAARHLGHRSGNVKTADL